MARKKVNCTKQRVRFCQLDYYRQIVTGETTKIQGIDTYVATDNVVKVLYTNGLYRVYNVNEGKKQLKDVIKIINAYLGGVGDGAQ